MAHEKTSKNSVVLWQENKEMGVGEPAILIEYFPETIALTQEGRVINLNYDSLKELKKLLHTEFNNQ